MKDSGKGSSPQPSDSEYDFEVDSDFGLTETDAHKVMTVLNIARDCTHAFTNSKIAAILKEALHRVWLKLLEIPSYVMTRNEFAVFNFFQDIYIDAAIAAMATDARAVYWDQTRGNSIG
ncbi:hypothetical protein F4814DRAFT_451498 [Daldinia grandis]|nr:hypothetical protein F4814DRAFT_451498 [Daldinia grandis]